MEPSQMPYVLRQVKRVLASAKLTPPAKLLEVGCGMGRYTFSLARLGFDVEGQDLNEKLLEYFRGFDAGRFNIPVHCGDVAFPPEEHQLRYDAVLGFFVLHHMHDLSACFRGMFEVLKPGGTLIFVEPNPYNPLYYLQILLTPGMTWEGDKGMLGMTKKKIFSALNAAGFSDPQCERFGCLPPFLTNRWGGEKAEAVLEKINPGPLRPFQIFRAKKL